jgi:purine-binding chemotaxis protein CheW
MQSMCQLVVFALDGQRYALPLDTVERVVRMVNVTSLPKAPAIVSGVVNAGGQITPVVNMRKRCRLPERDVALSDQLIVARTARRPLALVVDTVLDVVECPRQDIIPAERILAEMEYVAGVVKLADGMLFIHDLDTFLSREEAQSLDDAIGNV